jgi:hypothetical protein
MSLHIYRSPGQSLIKEQRCPWIMRGIKIPALKPNRLVWSRCCEKKRPAKNCYVQHYYDGSNIFCSPGKGCKDAKVLKREERRLFKVRSNGARAGWRTRRRRASNIFNKGQPKNS